MKKKMKLQFKKIKKLMEDVHQAKEKCMEIISEKTLKLRVAAWSITKYLSRLFFEGIFAWTIGLLSVYLFFNWNSPTGYERGEIFNAIRKEIGNPDTKILPIKADLTGFSQGALIFFTGQPRSILKGNSTGTSFSTVSQVDFPKIFIFEKIQKNPIDAIIHSGDLYQKVTSFELIKKNYDGDDYGDEFGYELGGVRVIKSDVGDKIAFSWISMDGVSASNAYFGLLGFNFHTNSYEIKPLLKEEFSCSKNELRKEHIVRQGKELDSLRSEAEIKKDKMAILPMVYADCYPDTVSVKIRNDSEIKQYRLTQAATDGSLIIYSDGDNLKAKTITQQFDDDGAHGDPHDAIVQYYQFSWQSFEYLKTEFISKYSEIPNSGESFLMTHLWEDE